MLTRKPLIHGPSMLSRDRAVLIVTDIQGRLASLMYERERLYRRAGIMIEGAKILGLPILWAEQYPEGLGETVPEIASHLDGYEPLAKKTFSSMRDPGFERRFRETGRDQAVITGIETHVCVHQTSLDLLDRGMEVQVVADAVSSRTAFDREIGLEKITRAGGVITSVETALFEMLERAEGPEFKAMLKLVK